MRELISLFRELIGKRKLVTEACQGGFPQALCRLVLWNCLDVYPADGYDRDLCVHLR